VHVLVLATISIALDLSLPLSALVMGAVAATMQSEDAAQRTFVAVRAIEQPLYLAFFALAGASIHFGQLRTLGLLGLAYVLARLVGKLAGGLAGGLLGGMAPRDAAALGVDLIPQAGVAVGLAVLASEALPGPGEDVATIVLGSVVLFELVGPLLVSRSLSTRAVDARPAEGPIRVDDRLPATVLLASRVHAGAPPWFVDWCARMGASLTVLGHDDDESGEQVVELRQHARDLGVPFSWQRLTGESFAGDAIRIARDIGADLVVVTALRVPDGAGSRTLQPHERIWRHLSCPVLVIPVEGGEGDLPPRLTRLLRRLP